MNNAHHIALCALPLVAAALLALPRAHAATARAGAADTAAASAEIEQSLPSPEHCPFNPYARGQPANNSHDEETA